MTPPIHVGTIVGGLDNLRVRENLEKDVQTLIELPQSTIRAQPVVALVKSELMAVSFARDI